MLENSSFSILLNGKKLRFFSQVVININGKCTRCSNGFICICLMFRLLFKIYAIGNDESRKQTANPECIRFNAACIGNKTKINMHKVKNHHYITVGVLVCVVKIGIFHVRKFKWREGNKKPSEWDGKWFSEMTRTFTQSIHTHKSMFAIRQTFSYFSAFHSALLYDCIIIDWM